MTRPDQTNPLPQLILDRARRARELLWEARWASKAPLEVAGSKLLDEAPDISTAAPESFQPVLPGEFFATGKDWNHRVFKLSIPAAGEDEAGRRYLHWACQGESTVYLDGQAWAGLDIGHPEAPLPDQACELYLHCGCWQTGIWEWDPATGPVLEHGLRFDKAEITIRNEPAWHAHWDFDVWIRLVEHALEQEGYESGIPQMCFRPPLDETSPFIRHALHGLDHAVAAYRSEGAEAASSVLKSLAERLPSEAWQPDCSFVGHAHLDLVWLWPESASVHKAVHTTSTLERLFERYPEFVFSQSMAAWYRMVEDADPDQTERIKGHIASGRWEATGAMEVESDTLIPHGEALVRAVIYGNRKLTELRGEPSPLCWLPDTFGYSSALPQILSLAGVPWFFTTKLSWSMVNRFPFNKFRWRSPDGSEVISYLFTTDYNQNADPKAVRTQAAKNRQLEIHNEILMPTGYGDGAGGPAEYMLERARRMQNISGVPRCRWSTAEAFMGRLAEHADELPVHQGELYLEAHRGTTTTQSEVKRLYRTAERALQAHEAARVVTGGGPIGEDAWRRLLFSQFHDALPGSSITRVFDELRAELEAIGTRELDAAQSELGAGYAMFNPVPIDRTSVVDGKLVTAGPLAAVTPTDEAQRPITSASATELSSPDLSASFNADGLNSLLVAGEQLVLAGPGRLWLYEDTPAYFDAWDIDHDLERHGQTAGSFAFGVTHSSPLSATLEAKSQIGKASEATLRYRIDAQCPWLFVELDIDWHEDHRLLRYELPTLYNGAHARFGSAFGAVSRPQQPGTITAEAMWEVPGSRWAAATRDDGTGAAIVTEAKYGFRCRSGVLSATLLRSPTFPDETADRGKHSIRFALGRYRPGETATAAESLYAEWLPSATVRPPLFEQSGGPTVTPCWALPSETGEGFVLRMHETAGAAGELTLRFADAVKSAASVDLLEQPRDGGPTVSVDGREVHVTYNPYDLISVLIRR